MLVFARTNSIIKASVMRTLELVPTDPERTSLNRNKIVRILKRRFKAVLERHVSGRKLRSENMTCRGHQLRVAARACLLPFIMSRLSFHKGLEFYKAGNYQEALRHFNEV